MGALVLELALFTSYRSGMALTRLWVVEAQTVLPDIVLIPAFPWCHFSLCDLLWCHLTHFCYWWFLSSSTLAPATFCWRECWRLYWFPKTTFFKTSFSWAGFLFTFHLGALLSSSEPIGVGDQQEGLRVQFFLGSPCWGGPGPLVTAGNTEGSLLCWRPNPDWL